MRKKVIINNSFFRYYPFFFKVFTRFKHVRMLGRICASLYLFTKFKTLETSTIIGIIEFLRQAYSERICYMYKRHMLIKFNDSSEVLLLGEKIFKLETYKLSCPKINPIIVDLGANIGLATLYLKLLYPDSTIYSFEPNTLAFKALKTNIKVNNLKNVYAFNQSVVGREITKKFIYLARETTTVSSLYSQNLIPFKYDLYKKLPTRLLSFNALLEKLKRIDLLKIDIEGEERNIIPEIAKNSQRIYSFMIAVHQTTGSNNIFKSVASLSKKYKLAIGIFPVVGIEEINNFLFSSSAANYFMLYGVKNKPIQNRGQKRKNLTIG